MQYLLGVFKNKKKQIDTLKYIFKNFYSLKLENKIFGSNKSFYCCRMIFLFQTNKFLSFQKITFISLANILYLVSIKFFSTGRNKRKINIYGPIFKRMLRNLHELEIKIS